MHKSQVHLFYHLLEDFYVNEKPPSVTQISNNCSKDPFRVLISTIISLRTKDAVTVKASERLFRLANNPRSMLGLLPEEIQEAIYPAGFYKRKSYTILEICRTLLNDYNGLVPADIDQLLKLKGVGRKTANLVLIEGFDMEGICVDVHVHRICNRTGLVKTKTADDTELYLRGLLPKKYWKKLNEMLVVYGQKVCRPRYPLCSCCKISEICDKVGIKNRGINNETSNR